MEYSVSYELTQLPWRELHERQKWCEEHFGPREIEWDRKSYGNRGDNGTVLSVNDIFYFNKQSYKNWFILKWCDE